MNGRHWLVRSRIAAGFAFAAGSGGAPTLADPANTPMMQAPVASLTVTPSASYIVTADTLQLTATALTTSGAKATDKRMTWSSDLASVATVSSTGTVTPVGPGIATITVTVDGQSATARVSVKRGRGLRVPSMMAYDSVIPAVMARYGVPGASVAVMRGGKLVFARSYGYADTALKTLVEPTSLFRIASISKPITSVAIMKLVEQGKLKLDDRVFTILNDIRPANVAAMDARLPTITIRHLLTHSAGWDSDISGDPMFMSTAAATATGTQPPAGLRAVLTYWMSKPLDFAPGTRFAYSNLGYGVLGLIIERVTGQSYENFVKANVLAPAGVTRTQLGHTLATQRAAGEVRYYDPAVGNSVFPGGGIVPAPDGMFYVEPMAAHGGWIASAPDLLRFSSVADGFSDRPDILSPASLTAMTERPGFWSGNFWYGFGWLVNTGPHWWHNGSLPGTATLLVRTGLGVSWAILLNSRVTPAGLPDLGETIDNEMWVAYRKVSSWPSHDLFDRY